MIGEPTPGWMWFPLVGILAFVVGLMMFAAGLAYAGYVLDEHAWQSGVIAKCQKENIEC